MLFSTLLNVVDTFYAGLLSSTALAALSLAGPLFFLVLTLGIGVGQATNALVGNRLGAGDPGQARKLAMQSISFAIVVTAVAGVLAYFFVPTLFTWMGGEPPYIGPATHYIRVVLVGSVFYSLGLVVNSILNTRGDTRSYRNAQIAGFIANIGLDPLFMFTLGMGVVGVALATVVIQAGVFFYMMRKVIRLDFMQDIQLVELLPEWSRYREIAAQSVPTSLSMGLVAVGAIVIVAFVTRFGEPAMAAYAVALRLEQVILLPVIGLNIAALSMTSVSYGARQYARVRQVHRSCTLYAVVMMITGGIVVFLFGGFFMGLFNKDPEVVAIGSLYLRFQAFIMPAYGVIFLSAAVLQGLKKPLYALYFNFFRQVIGLWLLFTIALDYLGTGITGIWWSMLIINSSVAVLIYLVVLRISPSGENQALPPEPVLSPSK